MRIRIRTIFVAVVCMAAFSSLAASDALAAGTTSFTCVAGSGEANTNSNCEPGSSGTSGNVAISAGEALQFGLEPEGTAEFKTKIGLSTVVLKATGVECVECTFENQEVGGVMSSVGEGRIRYTGMTINIASCKVTGGQMTSEPLKFRGFLEGETAEMEVSPVSGTTAMVIHLEKSGSEACALGSEIKVTGLGDWLTRGAKWISNAATGTWKVGTQAFSWIAQHIEFHLTLSITIKISNK